MSSNAASMPADVQATLAAQPRWPALDRLLVRAGEWLNPILVKEARQSLKSRQFVFTFALLLICCWVWSIYGTALLGPEISYSSRGPFMFIGYYVILAFPLLIIVPFGAFRSLASEQEDRTYELLSITALSPRQIVSGKLGSAVLQMLIYLSAISPCLAFTYMLRGIAFPTILFAIFYTVLGSLALSLIGLLAGTLTGEKHWQVVLSVVLIIGLLVAFWMAIVFVVNISELPFAERGFWQVNAAFLTGYAAYFALFFFTTVAGITFASDNRSTRLRITMLAQHVLFTGWMAWLWIGEADGDMFVLALFLIFIGIHWYVMGAFMTGESPQLSPRVKRRLPQSFLGRAFLTWFNPGPGTGYLFAICGGLGALALVGIASIGVFVLGFQPGTATRWSPDRALWLMCFGALEVSYVAVYLGIGLLVLRPLHKRIFVSPLFGVLVQILLLLLGSGIPLIVYLMTPSLRYSGYSLLYVTDPFRTLWHVGGLSDASFTLPAEAPMLLVMVPLTAAIVLLFNLPAVAREVQRVRVARPERVAEEDAQLAAELAPPKPVRISPWDEEYPTLP